MSQNKQEVPSDLVNQLMLLVRNKFCGQMDGKEWGKHSHFVRRNVILWPARFICDQKGFVVSADRYEQIMRAVFVEIGQNMTLAPIRYWPGYLMKCVQEHWHHHWEEYYQEAKSAMTLTQSGIVALGRLPERSDRAVEVMSATLDILVQKRKQKRSKAAPQETLPGF